MGLRDVMTEVGAKLNADMVFVQTAEGKPLFVDGVDFGGPEEWAKYNAPPSIVWKPTTTRYRAAQGAGGGAGREADLWRRDVLLSVRVWAATTDQVEILINAFINAMHALNTQNSYEPAGEDWDTTGVVKSGFACTLAFFVTVPVPRTPVPRRPITQVIPHFKLGNTEV